MPHNIYIYIYKIVFLDETCYKKPTLVLPEAEHSIGEPTKISSKARSNDRNLRWISPQKTGVCLEDHPI